MPTVLPSSIFDFVLGTSPSWSSKVCTLQGRTLYAVRYAREVLDIEVYEEPSSVPELALSLPLPLFRQVYSCG